MTSTSTTLTYRAAGVDIDAGDLLVERIKPLARATFRPEVVAGIGGFGALMEIPKRFKDPLLVSGTDGVGTKLKLAFATGIHDTIGIDLVAMSVNDILVQGAEPLFFLDYFACGKLDVDVGEAVVRGIATGCTQAGCALIGGETAEMPGMYADGEYDLAGFAVGVVERDRVIDGRTIRPGDAVLGLASSGPHSNGYSLIRRILEISGVDITDAFGESTVGATLLTPTRIYVKAALNLMRNVRVKGLAHITGGGLVENVPRILADGLTAALDSSSWVQPAVFSWLQEAGGVGQAEMLRVFNCGIGMVVVVDDADATAATAHLQAAGETVFRIGTIETRQDGAPRTIVV